MQAVVMAGGFGMRLRPHTDILPKPLTPIEDMPVIEVLLRRIATQGVTRAVICTGSKARLVRAYLKDVPNLGLDLTYHQDPEPRGTAGALGDIAGLLEEDFLVLNADVLTDADVGGIMNWHRDKRAALTLAVSRRDWPIPYGVVECDEADVVIGMREKPVATVDLNLGMYALSRRHVDPVLKATQGRLDMPDLIASLLASGQMVSAARIKCRWFDIGRESDLLAAREAYAIDPDPFLGVRAGAAD
ncbi:MAG: NTP transferase domain-containing protein [Hyphomicrobiales bacterium]|nr:NTP transferase domain-containing protein [Hyphomicrobiales bacterium]